MKETRATHWKDINTLNPNLISTNESGFIGLPGSYRFPADTVSFIDAGSIGYCWSSTEHSAQYAWYRNQFYDHTNVRHYYIYKEFGFRLKPYLFEHSHIQLVFQN